MLKFLKFYKEKKLIEQDRPKDKYGRAIINITIKDKDEVLSPFIIDNNEAISADFANHIDNAVKSIPPKQDINININCENLKEEDKTHFSLAIKNYYKNSVLDNQRKIKTNLKLFLIMIVLSLLSITVLFLFDYFNVNWLIKEIIDIITWVFVWEAVDIMVFQRAMIIYERQRDLALFNSFITFNGKTKN